MALSFESLRVGHTYRIKNYGEVREFKVVKRLSSENFLIKDTLTLEEFELHDIVRYGKGKDFDLDEINDRGDII